MKLVTSTQMKKLDAKSINEFNVPSLELMEKAGLGTAQICKNILGDGRGKKVFIFCGKGNNGGDGFVVGRYLSKWKYKVQFYLLGKSQKSREMPRLI